MSKKIQLLSVVLASLTILLTVAISSCSAPESTPGATQPGSPGPGGPGGAVIQSDSIVTGQVQAVRSNAYGYPWEIDFVVISSNDVGNLPNPTKDKIGQVITAKADQDLSQLTKGTKFTANVKYVGDVPQPGISLYVSNIKVTQ